MEREILWILFAGFAVSYGWGMRGTIIGGERGALLPGAIIGMIFAFMSGNAYFIENFALFAAAGALTMFYGGSEPYGETLGFVLKRRESEGYKYKAGLAESAAAKGCEAARLGFRRGAAGTFIKGALWFAICGAGLGMMFGALSGKYRWYDFVIVFGTLPLAQEIGVLIFNKPYDKFKGIYPKIYFSLTRREEWGGNVIMLLELTVLALVRQDYFPAILALFGFASGGVGFLGGLLIYDVTEHPLKNGKYIFGRAQKGGFIDGWKIMEHFFGALGGGGLALGFVLFRNYANEASACISANGAWNVLGGKGDAAAWIMLGLFAVIMLQYAFLPKYEKRLSEEKRFRLGHIVEIIERPFFAAFPLMLVFLGSLKMAQLSCGFIILWVVTEKCAFSRFTDFKHRGVITAALFAVPAIFLVSEIAYGFCGAYKLLIMYTAYYTLLAAVCDYRPRNYIDAKRNNRLKNYFCNTVILNFVFQTAVILIIGAQIFR